MSSEQDVQLGVKCVVLLSLELVFVDGPAGSIRKQITVPNTTR